jgi:integrase/recombinase XerD
MYFEPEEVEAVLRSAPRLRDKALLAVVYQCALRRGEVAFLRRDDYNPGRGMLKVTRLKKDGAFTHEIALWRRTKQLLNKYLASRRDHFDALFLSRKGGDSVGGHAVYRIFRNAAEKAGMAVRQPRDGRGLRHPSPHRLRHSFAVHSMNFGARIEDVQEHLGHSSINSTLVYARVLNPRKKRIALLTEASHHFAKF